MRASSPPGRISESAASKAASASSGTRPLRRGRESPTPHRAAGRPIPSRPKARAACAPDQLRPHPSGCRSCDGGEPCLPQVGRAGERRHVVGPRHRTLKEPSPAVSWPVSQSRKAARTAADRQDPSRPSSPSVRRRRSPYPSRGRWRTGCTAFFPQASATRPPSRRSRSQPASTATAPQITAMASQSTQVTGWRRMASASRAAITGLRKNR